jgi:hypothetical protein
MNASMSTTVLMALAAWVLAAVLMGLVIGRAIAACSAHDSAFPEPPRDLAPEPPSGVAAERDRVPHFAQAGSRAASRDAS